MTMEHGAGAPPQTNLNGTNGAVEPPTSETVTLTPAEASGGLRATFWVEVTNHDVKPVTYTLAGHDRGQRLRYVFEPAEMTLAPGQKARVNLQVYASQHVIGRARRHLFAVIVSHGDGRAPRMLAGRFKQQALVPEWVLALVCICLLAWAASYLDRHPIEQPTSNSTPPVRTQPPFTVRNDSNGFSVLDSGIRILTINTNSAGFKAKKRAQIVAERLNDILMNDLPKPDRSVEGFFQGDLDGAQIVGFGYLTGHRNVKNATADLIVTVDAGSARLDGGRTPRVLACWRLPWRILHRNVQRRALESARRRSRPPNVQKPAHPLRLMQRR